jgi:hypothetical protein
MAKRNNYNIVRRAYSQRVVVDQFKGNYAEAENFAAALKVRNGFDGEYFAVPAEYVDLQYPADGPTSSDLPIAWL